jgi:VIT1/CCC1 family predicted Fe2+/Mn2+ transporter
MTSPAEKNSNLVSTMNPDNHHTRMPHRQHHERNTLPSAPDLEANRPLLSRTSTLQGQAESQQVPIVWSDKYSRVCGSGFWSNWRFRLDARIISDAILGLSDGLTVPFALTAGLTALGDTRVVILGGLAELVAGAISMGLGGYVGAKSEV